MQTIDIAAYLQDLEFLVNTESPSRHPEGTAKIAAFFTERFSAMGWNIQPHAFNAEIGPCLEITNNGKKPYDLLIMAHMDTVFPVGTTSQRPFTIKDGKAYGPGVNDMKSGLLAAYYALQSLQASGLLENSSICVAMNSDEEISSIYSRPWLEELSKVSRHAFVLEPARANGALVNQRKGVGRFSMEFNGVSAHSGVDHEKGISAINELGHWIVTLHEMTNYQAGTTVNVGVVQGGMSANTVADQAKAQMDIRFTDNAEAEKIQNVMQQMIANPATPGIKIQVSGGVTRPPMNPSAKTLELCRAIDIIAEKSGISFEWAATGGGSDGNFSAAFGVPTIDGMGPVGGGSHSNNEYLVVDSLAPHLALLQQAILHVVTIDK